MIPAFYEIPECKTQHHPAWLPAFEERIQNTTLDTTHTWEDE